MDHLDELRCRLGIENQPSAPKREIKDGVAPMPPQASLAEQGSYDYDGLGAFRYAIRRWSRGARGR